MGGYYCVLRVLYKKEVAEAAATEEAEKEEEEEEEEEEKWVALVKFYGLEGPSRVY